MGITNFDAVSVAGVPTMGISNLPLTTGQYFFCDYAYGSDGAAGSADDPLKTITEGYSRAVDGRGDVIVIVSRPDATSATLGTQRLTATLTWAKYNTHLVGLCAPTMVGQRARISQLTAATTALAPMMTVSGQDCIFKNFSFFQGSGQASTAERLMDVTGQRNYFQNVTFGGMGHANSAAQAGSYDLYLNAGSENTFDGCFFGTDTIARTAANTNVKLGGGAARNVFRDCLFAAYATAATPTFIDANASAATDRFNLFKRCIFNNSINSGSGTAMTAAVAFHASQGGTTIIDDCTVVGATNWAASNTGIVKVSGSVPNGHTSGVALSAATS